MSFYAYPCQVEFGNIREKQSLGWRWMVNLRRHGASQPPSHTIRQRREDPVVGTLAKEKRTLGAR